MAKSKTKNNSTKQQRTGRIQSNQQSQKVKAQAETNLKKDIDGAVKYIEKGK